MRSRSLTLLEVLLVVALLTIAAGLIVWRLDRWIQHHRFHSDALRLKSLIFQARSLALHTQADWELRLVPTLQGVELSLLCREDPARAPSGQRLLPLSASALDAPLVLEFFSSGALAPHTPFVLRGGPAQNMSLCLPELFQQKESVAKVRIQPESVP